MKIFPRLKCFICLCKKHSYVYHVTLRNKIIVRRLHHEVSSSAVPPAVPLVDLVEVVILVHVVHVWPGVLVVGVSTAHVDGVAGHYVDTGLKCLMNNSILSVVIITMRGTLNISTAGL